MKKPRLTSLRSIAIHARKWRDNVNGNTYHSVMIKFVLSTGAHCHMSSGLTYGYGEQWKQTARDLICEHLGVMEKEKKLVPWQFFKKYKVDVCEDPRPGPERNLWKADVNIWRVEK